jgi:hypothetical protein
MQNSRAKWILFFGVGLLFALVLYLGYRLFCSVPYTGLIAEAISTGAQWQGIIPGQTSRDEALKKLQSSQYVRRASITTGTSEAFDNSIVEVISWDNRAFSMLPFAHWPSSEIAVTNGRVSSIAVPLTDAVTVEKAIGYLGLPEKVYRRQDRDTQGSPYTQIYLIYPSKGMVLECRGSYYARKGLLVQDSPVLAIHYLAASSLEGIIELMYRRLPAEADLMHDWKGYDPTPSL